MSKHKNGVVIGLQNGDIIANPSPPPSAGSRKKIRLNWIYLLSFMDLFGVSLIIPLFPGHMKKIGISPVVGGFLGSIYGFVQFISSPYIGSYSDTHGRYAILQLCLLSTCFSYILLGFSDLSVILILIARIIAGIFKHSQTLLSTHLGERVNDEQFSSEQSYFNAFGSIGFIIGPTVAGHILAQNGTFSFIAFLAAACLLLNAGLVWKLFPKEGSQRAKTRENVSARSKDVRPTSSFTQTFKHLQEVGISTCWDIYLVRFLLSFASLVFRSHLALVLMEAYQIGPKEIGYIISFQGTVSAAVGFLGKFFFGLYTDESKATPHASLVFCLALLGILFQPPIYVVCILLAFLCCSNTVLKVSLSRVLHVRSESGKRGAMFGLSQSVTSFARMLSPLVAGLAMEYSHGGPTTVAFISGGIATLISFFVLPSVGKIHQS